MQMPETGVLIANVFGVIVVFISLGASVTIFSLWTSPEFLLPHRAVSFVFVNDNHFVMVELNGDYPMPTPTWYWSRFKSQDAAAWEMWYKPRLDSYTNWLESRRHPPGFVDLDNSYGEDEQPLQNLLLEELYNPLRALRRRRESSSSGASEEDPDMILDPHMLP
ncbi:hypothetical protein E3N88_19573 [Mikania micrantha]|uniref:Uncharacterized protein n=1 Tax=Mikania micrantha TaxID=192012 RepID=A0A5N6NRN6_9ASTR|nr:hypothetical protein E3N88_19573 [Mikania micrantha]